MAMLPFSFSEVLSFAPELIILFGIGFFAGFIGGMFGIGGGLVIVPMLYHIAGSIGLDHAHEMQVIMATSLAAIVFTGIGSLKTRILHNEINWHMVKESAPLMFLGAIVGAYLNSLFPTKVITVLFAVFCFILGVKMLQKRKVKGNEALKSKHLRHSIAISIGSIASLMGISGGTMTVPFFKSRNLPMKIAIGTSSILNSVIAFSGTICFIIAGMNVPDLDSYYFGYVNWVVLICLVPTIILGAPVGAKASRLLSDRLLAVIFAIFLLLNAAKMLVNVI